MTASQPTWMARNTDPGSSITLSRATYKIGKDQSAALASLLGSIKATVMETKVDGNSITVTTTPEAQRAIGQIVQLMKGADGQGRTYEFRYTPVTSVTSATPAVPATPKPPVAPKPPATPRPASIEFKLGELEELFELGIEPATGKVEGVRRAIEGLRLAVLAPTLPPKPATKPAAPVRP